MLWCAMAFALLAISNGLLILDKVSLPQGDLTGARLLTTGFGVGLLIVGVLREAR